jgi:mannose-1-phosphate guanylyltransferase
MTAAPPKALLVAAGIGSRLAPLTDMLPKCLMPVNGVPLLAYWLELLARGGVRDIVVNLHHHAPLMREWLGRNPHAQGVQTSHEETLLGTAGTLLRNRDRLAGGPVFFAHADNLSSFSPSAFFEAHRRRPARTAITMMTFTTDVPRQCGIVELGGDGLVIAMHEKSAAPPGNLANAAVYMIEAEVFEFIAGLGKPAVDFSTEVLPHFMGRIATFHNDIYHRDIGTPASLVRAQFEFPLLGGARPCRDEDPWFGLMRDERRADFLRALNMALDIARPAP